MTDSAIVFGARGALGSAICSRLTAEDVAVSRATRAPATQSGWLGTSQPDWANAIAQTSVNRVIWAQGANAEGGIADAGVEQLAPLFEANVLYIATTLRALLDREALAPRARLVIVSSVWQSTARSGKLAYATTKAALAGLVRSLVADMGPAGLSVNAVLPGVVDTPMTRQFLSPEQVQRLQRDTPLGELVSADNVARTCAWLSSPASAGVNGQFVTVDAGWSVVRHV